MTDTASAFRYPRRRLLRYLLRMMGRVLFFLFTRTAVSGREHFPTSGPLILVGNHAAFIEVALMMVYAPWNIEFVGTADVPIDPRFAWTADLYGGFLPVNRGSTDRSEINLPLEVLSQQGIIAIFPEGGIWSTTMERARTGVAWLSYRGHTPVLPIGFGGMRGAIQAIMQFKRPHLVMNIGQLMPPVDPKTSDKPRKQALEEAANAIMAEVAALVPESEKAHWNRMLDERFDFEMTINGAAQAVEHREGLGRLFHVPVILDVMVRNFDLPVQPLQQGTEIHEAKTLLDALDTALGYLKTHDQFLNYRFGYRIGAEIEAGMLELRALLQQAGDQPVTLTPVHRYRDRASGQEIIETVPGIMHEM